MSINRYALIKNGIVTNVVLWDGDEKRWQPPEDVDAVVVDDGWGFGCGDIYEYATGDFYRVVTDNDGAIEE